MRKWVSSAAYGAAVDLLVEARKARGLTQRELEQRLGKRHHGFIAKIEGRERQMNVVEFVAIARALEADEQALFAELLGRLPAEIEV